jgi:hypothetical protein
LQIGFTAAWTRATKEQRAVVTGRTPFEYPGMESTVKVAEFLWDSQIAAVAGDCPGFEAWPPCFAESNPAKPNCGKSKPSESGYGGGGDSDLGNNGLHPVLLAGWGMPIGELFDLEALAAECKRQQRWSFFVTSQPLNVRGGVASPPNAVAIF